MANPISKEHIPVTEETLKGMTIKKGSLYWDNKEVATKTRLGLFTKIWLGLVSVLAAFASLSTIANNANSINNTWCFWVGGSACVPKAPTGNVVR